MNPSDIHNLLQQVAAGYLPVAEAEERLRWQPFEDLGFAQVDHHRSLRQGTAEVIYGAGKTAEQMIAIARSIRQQGENAILITRLSAESAEIIRKELPLQYFADAKVGLVGDFPAPNGQGTIAIACAGTSDLPVAEEAALTAQALGNEVTRIYDVGVAGLHRLLAHRTTLEQARVIIAVAGMEGALASVIGGLVSCPVIAVPTSVGYGASFGGVTALLAMLNSCASGVSVVNIDNGFGAAYQASLINHLGGNQE